ncbi:response regulator [Geoalkalibacter halelectricus]|uniref:Response regulator n=1 Tax=Geoalkalibacter halelectricus TaxID=2847045 RepID=A0ABY5ZLM9_9BACT|nr:response regulator [Geoalkalibacter halelectricus]MDO3378621.1 response regulator [Geoalkalibacter halelectricus]UWZ80067.1 response regulator [Geoalkalibacter halelectricus]
MSRPVLVIDDDPGIRRFLSRALQLRGYEVETCARADEGVDRLMHGEYRLALIDIQMPGWSGIEACRSLRAQPATRTLPIILMTAFYQDDENLRRQVDEVGANAVLLKPFTLDELLERIAFLLGPAPVPTPPALESVEGDLAETLLPRLLHNLYSLKATGLLYLERAETQKVVYLRNGYPIFMRSNLVRECLGKMLIRDKFLTERECEQSLARMKESGRLQGTVLMEMGLLSPHHLHDALQRQMTEKLLEVFSWPEGHYRFQAARRFKKGVTAIELAPAALILEGIRRFWSPLQVSAFLAEYLECFPQITANPHYRFQGIELSAAEQRLLEECRGEHSLADLLEGHPLVRPNLEKLLAALILARVVEPLEHPVRVATRAPSAGAAPRVAAAGAREDILRDHQRMLAQDYFSLLGVTNDVGAEELRRAYFSLAKRYHPDRFRHEHLSADLQARVEEIFQRLRLAYETLSDPARRQAYLVAHSPEAGPGAPGTDLPQAEIAFREGREWLRRGRTEKALPLLRAAVEMCPDEPEYLTACAWAMHRHRPQDREEAGRARRMLLRSARLNPASDLTQLYLGYVLRFEGRESEAERRFEIAAMCNPDCKAALRELRLIAMRRAGTGAKGGILGRWWRGLKK